MNNNEVKKKKIYQKVWFWIVILIVILIIAVSNNTNTNSKNTDSNETSNSSISENSKSEVASSSIKQTFGINDKASIKDLDYTVLSVFDTKQLSIIGEETQNNYVVIKISVTNNGTTEKTLYPSSFNYFRGDNIYEYSSDAIYLENGFWTFESIGAGLTKTINIVFEIPTNHEKTDYIEFGDWLTKIDVYMGYVYTVNND